MCLYEVLINFFHNACTIAVQTKCSVIMLASDYTFVRCVHTAITLKIDIR